MIGTAFGRRVTGTTNMHNVRVEAHEVIIDRDDPSYLLPYTTTIAQLFITAANTGIVRAKLRDAKGLLLSLAGLQTRRRSPSLTPRTRFSVTTSESLVKD